MHRLTRTVPGGKDQRGVTVIILALTITVLMIAAAFALDVGGAYNQRREYQNAADAAALSGAQSLPTTSSARSTIIGSVQTNASDRGFATTDFNTCASDSPPSSIHSLTAITWIRDATDNCIAYDSSGELVWVDVPQNHPYLTVFGKLAGVTSYNIGASAVAGRIRPGEGGVLPFGIQAGTGFGAQCVKTGSGNPGGSCTGNTTGNFGYLDFGTYGNAAVGTTCQTPSGNSLIAQNIAVGIDHDLSLLAAPPGNGTTVVEQGTSCDSPLDPNTVGVKTGNVTPAIDDGILHGVGFSDGNGGRLTRTGLETGIATFNATTTIAGESGVDDTGLWQFIPETTLAGVPTSCQRATFDSTYSANAGNKAALKTAMETALNTCFTDYGNGTGCPVAGSGQAKYANCGALFTANSRTESPVDLYDIQLSARFGYVPVLTGPFPNGNSGTVSFASFTAVYMQGLAGQGFDFDPGVGDGNQSGNKADSLSAYLIYPNMLPGTIGSDPFGVGQNVEISLLK